MESVVSHIAVPVVDRRAEIRRTFVRECLRRAHTDRTPAAEARAEFARLKAWADSLDYRQCMAAAFIVRAQDDPAFGTLARRAMARAVGMLGTCMPPDLPAAEKDIVPVVRRILRRW